MFSYWKPNQTKTKESQHRKLDRWPEFGSAQPQVALYILIFLIHFISLISLRSKPNYFEAVFVVVVLFIFLISVVSFLSFLPFYILYIIFLYSLFYSVSSKCLHLYCQYLIKSEMHSTVRGNILPNTGGCYQKDGTKFFYVNVSR